MSRKYLNDKYCVRCNRKTVCPYLRNNYKLIKGENKILSVLDIGCGNGRNSKFMKQKGHEVLSLDMVNDYGNRCILGQDKIPAKNKSANVILCNYLMMFLNNSERQYLLREIQRVAANDCKIMVELYPAKDSYAKDEIGMLKMQANIYAELGTSWKALKYSKGKFIAQKGIE